MGKYVGVDWAGKRWKRWVVVSITEESIDVGTQPSMQAVWDQHDDAELILVDIPIGLPENHETWPRDCDEAARDVVSGSRYSTIFDVPCRAAVQTSDYETAQKHNVDHIDDDSLGPQRWGFAERIHEVDVFMRNTETGETVRESHPEVCFAALSPGGSTNSKKTDAGQSERLDILRDLDERLAEKYETVHDNVEEMSAWQRRIGIGMMDDVMDAMVLAYTASLDAEDGLTALGGETDAAGLPMEIVRPKESAYD